MSEEFSYSALPNDSVSLSPPKDRPKPPQYAVKRKKALFIFATIQCVVAGIMLTLGCVCSGIRIRWNDCDVEGPIIVAILSFLSGVFGMVATKRAKARCLMVTFLIFCILATVVTVYEIPNTVYRIGRTADIQVRNETAGAEKSGDQKAESDNNSTLLMVNIIMLIAGIIHFICCNIASGLICAIWSKTGCCGSNQPPTIIYLQSGQISSVN